MNYNHVILGVSCRCALVLLLTGMAAPLATAQSGNSSELKVAVTVIPPFVMRQGSSYTGFAIDLWNAVATQMKVKTDYRLMSDTTSLLGAMRAKTVDIVGSPIAITAARDAEFDFSLPILQAGLQIMVRDTGETATSNPLEDLLQLLFSRTMLLWLGIALVLILIPAHLVWLLERGRKDGMITNPNYIPGIFEAMFWAVSGLTSQAQNMPHQWVARIFAVFWMFAGVVFVAFYTAQLTTNLTVRQIQGTIHGPGDLAGKRVATLANTVAADYLRAHDIRAQEFIKASSMIQALQTEQVEAIVFRAPVLLYYTAHEGKGTVKVVGPEFEVAPIGFGFQLDSPLRKRVNQALLRLRENGTYQQIHDKWFGTP
jgi:polar amino acid transport system substrate-binding protein